VLFSNSNGVYLGDARFEPVFEELERRKAVLFVHPTASPDPSAHHLGLPDSLIDFTADTTRAVARMHYSNRFARTPNVKHIFSHAGGTAPYLAGRRGIVDEMNVIPGGEERGPVADTLCTGTWPFPIATPSCGCCGMPSAWTRSSSDRTSPFSAETWR
jgi:6-methylsalicylate decarboxylase